MIIAIRYWYIQVLQVLILGLKNKRILPWNCVRDEIRETSRKRERDWAILKLTFLKMLI